MPTSPTPELKLPDPMQFAESLARVAEKSQRLVAEFLTRGPAPANLGMGDAASVGNAFNAFTTQLMADPLTLAQAQIGLWNEQALLWQRAAQRLLGVAGGDERRGNGSARARQALPQPRLERERDLRLHQAELFRDGRFDPLHGQADRGARRQDGAQGRVLHAPIRRCDRAFELPGEQPGGDRGDLALGRREPAQRPRASARGYRARQGSARRSR